jgi:hypothetical protein
MFNNVRTISSGTCENSQFENIDNETCSSLALSRDATFRTVTNSKYAPGCVQVGDAIYYNNAPLIGGSSSNDAVQQLCMLPNNAKPILTQDATGHGAPTLSDDRKHVNDRMFDGTWLDKSIVQGQSDNGRDLTNSGYFPVNIRTVHQAVFYVNAK